LKAAYSGDPLLSRFDHSMASDHLKAQMPPDDLAQLVQGSPNAIITADRHGFITSWNHGAEQIFGYSAEEAIGMNVRSFAPPSNADHQARSYELLLEGGSLPPMEIVRLRKDGSQVHLTVTLWPLRSPDQEIRGIIMIGMDITERKQAEAAQAEMNERFQVLADNIDQLVWIASVDGKEWWFNKR
jgi:PAS domain S-box-containing protein